MRDDLLIRFESNATREALMKKEGIAFANKAINFRVLLK
jgi:hypothetical protein